MDDWKLAPARDLGLTGLQRSRSLRRESGLVESAARLAVWAGLRASLRLFHRLKVHGKENLPAAPPFVMAANHASHLDALVLGAALPLMWRDNVFPIAAGDVFFQRRGIAALTTALVNALPVWRRRPGAHATQTLRQRLVEDSCIYILFPEGGRTRDGTMQPFKAGVGMMAAGTPAPVVPCYLHGTFEAFPPGGVVPRLRRITLHIGQPLSFAAASNDHAGWTEAARAVEEAVRRLAALAGHDRP